MASRNICCWCCGRVVPVGGVLAQQVVPKGVQLPVAAVDLHAEPVPALVALLQALLAGKVLGVVERLMNVAD